MWLLRMQKYREAEMRASKEFDGMRESPGTVAGFDEGSASFKYHTQASSAGKRLQ